MIDTQSSYSAKIDVEHEIACTEQEESGVGLWQWVQTDNEGKFSLLSEHTICRYGVGYD